MTPPAPRSDAPDPPLRDDPTEFRGLRVGVVGLGIEGIDTVRFLHEEGAAEIIVSERKPIDALRDEIRALNGIPVAIEAGGNDPGIVGRVDALFVSQGVPDSVPLLEAARASGLPITAMMRLFLKRCPAPVIGITGSAGKTTVTSLVGEMFDAAGQTSLVGGNIGRGLLSTLDQVIPDSDVILEISHTQLVRTDRSPHVAAVLNVRPNHLDQFDWDSYVDLKRNLVRHQTPDDVVILPSDNEVARSLGEDTPAHQIHFGLEAFDGPGATVVDGAVIWRQQDHQVVCRMDEILVPGRHNLLNVLAAVAIGGTAGLPVDAMGSAIREFRGVAHRLETIAEIDRVRYVDDSIATTPERTVAAFEALAGPIVLLLGGREKRLPLAPLLKAAQGRVRAVIGFGEAGESFVDAFRRDERFAEAAAPPRLVAFDDLAAAVAEAQSVAQPDDTVLLSPAGTSFDAYPNFAARGDHFRALVRGEEPDDGSS